MLGATGLAIGGLAAAGSWGEISYILRNTIFEKDESTSFLQRSYADLLAVSIFFETYGIGLGLGSHKANSLILTLLSNVGIAGLLLFSTFVVSLLRSMSRAALDAADVNRGAVGAFQAALLGLIIIHAFSNPNLSTLLLWVQMGAVLSLRTALLRHGSLRAHATARAPASAPAAQGTLWLKQPRS